LPDSELLRYCAVYPVGATNVTWQLVLLAGGEKPSSQVQVSATISDVTAEVQP
jgi:hypothetical protein